MEIAIKRELPELCQYQTKQTLRQKLILEKTEHLFIVIKGPMCQEDKIII